MITAPSILNHQTPLAQRNWSVYVRSQKLDPTNTTTLRKRFEKEMDRRFNNIIRAITTALVQRDVFGSKIQNNVEVPGQNAFAFPTSAQKIDKFMDWIHSLVSQELLTVSEYQQLGDPISKSWMNKYIEDSYNRGIQRSRQELKKAGYKVPSNIPEHGFGYSFGTPFHADRVGLLYSRAYNELKGITDMMDNQISRVLTQGMIDGDGPMSMARKLRAVIAGGGNELGITDTLGRYIPAKRRAEMLARTETIRAFHQANIQEMKNWGAAGVVVQAEWSTAADGRVCDICAPLQGKVYTLNEIESLIPRHPNCRCMALPKKATETTAAKTIVKESENTQNISKTQVLFNNAADQAKYNTLKSSYDVKIAEVLGQTDQTDLQILKDALSEKTPYIDTGKFSNNFHYGQNKALESLRNLYVSEISEETRSAMILWQGNTNNKPCLTLKYFTSKMERGAGELKFSKRWLDDLPGNKIIAKNIMSENSLVISSEEYIQLRAFNQSLMEALGRNHDFVLYRGTGGSAGKSLKITISKGVKQGRKQFVIGDNSLSGYSESDAIAYKFGINDGGVSTRVYVSYKEVAVDRLLLSFMNNKFWDEQEMLIVSGNRSFKLSDIIYSTSQGGFR